jgi:hypothetical protein
VASSLGYAALDPILSSAESAVRSDEGPSLQFENACQIIRPGGPIRCTRHERPKTSLVNSTQ